MREKRLAIRQTNLSHAWAAGYAPVFVEDFRAKYAPRDIFWAVSFLVAGCVDGGGSRKGHEDESNK